MHGRVSIFFFKNQLMRKIFLQFGKCPFLLHHHFYLLRKLIGLNQFMDFAKQRKNCDFIHVVFINIPVTSYTWWEQLFQSKVLDKGKDFQRMHLHLIVREGVAAGVAAVGRIRRPPRFILESNLNQRVCVYVSVVPGGRKKTLTMTNITIAKFGGKVAWRHCILRTPHRTPFKMAEE